MYLKSACPRFEGNSQVQQIVIARETMKRGGWEVGGMFRR